MDKFLPENARNYKTEDVSWLLKRDLRDPFLKGRFQKTVLRKWGHDKYGAVATLSLAEPSVF
jgi:hypothetical protein